MEIKLTTWERVQLIQLVGGARGNVVQVRLGLKALDILELDEAEKQRVGWMDVSATQSQWQDTELEWDLKFDDDTWAFIQALAKRRQDWPISSLVVQLLEKLGL